MPPPPAHDDPELVNTPLTCSIQVVPDNPVRVMPDDTSPALNVLTAVKMFVAPRLAVVWMTWALETINPTIKSIDNRRNNWRFMTPSGSPIHAATPDITVRPRHPLGVYGSFPDLEMKMLVVGICRFEEAIESVPSQNIHDLSKHLILFVGSKVV